MNHESLSAHMYRELADEMRTTGDFFHEYIGASDAEAEHQLRVACAIEYTGSLRYLLRAQPRDEYG